MVFLGYGKYVRSDRIYALQPLARGERGGGRRTLVWVEGIAEPITASRTERAILSEMGQGSALRASVADEALAFARDVADQAERVGPMLRTSIRSEAGLDLDAVARRARRLLARTVVRDAEAEPPAQLFDAEA